MTKNTLLIFLSDVTDYSNLLRALGEEKVREIIETLQSKIFSVVENIACEKIIFAKSEKLRAKMKNENFNAAEPSGIHFHEQLKNAFNQYVLQNSDEVSKVIFITASCPQLTAAVIEKAFESLNKYDVCIGPEKKGSYYLIGMKEPLPFLFDEKIWKGKHLLDDTLEELIEHGKNYFLLPELQSVSDIYDLHLLKKVLSEK